MKTKRTKEIDIHKKVFAAFVRREAGTYSVYLVNPTEWDYARVIFLTGGETSDDDYIMQTSKALHGFGPLARHSHALIESNDSRLLDFLIWFDVDLYEEIDANPFCARFFLPKYAFEQDMSAVPFLDEKGVKIELTERNDGPIIEKIDEIDFRPKSFDFS